MDTLLSRRRLLAAVSGAASVAGVGYWGARTAAREGVVNGRLVIGYETDGGTIVGQTDVLREYVDDDGPPDRRVNPDYREGFPVEPPMTVSASFHRELRRAFDEVTYALSHACHECSTPGVSRSDFNGARLGEEVGLLYHSDTATVVP